MKLLEIDILPYHQEFHKKYPDKPNFLWTSPTSHACSGAQILGNAGFYAAPTDDVLEETNTSGEQYLRGESCSGSPFLHGLCQDLSLVENLRPSGGFNRKHVVRYGLAPFFFEAKHTDRDHILELDLASAH